MSAFGVPIPESQICIIQDGMTKQDALGALINAVASNPAITDKEVFRTAIFEREARLSTGIGGGIAIPHVRIPEVAESTVGVGIASKGIDFGAADQQPVQVVVLFATPAGADKDYLKTLAQVMLSLRNVDFFERLTACDTTEKAFGLLNR
ncbi:MAG TPA: PTS sugar transporter subunit IIA [Candidatus Hydrogenedentes bacterium]|nr:PTS sugar transporter subunit IIA [Candidatus Hydrogenedentota bacterium]